MSYTHKSQLSFVSIAALCAAACGGGDEPKVPPQPAPQPQQYQPAPAPGQYPQQPVQQQPGQYPQQQYPQQPAPAQPGVQPAPAAAPTSALPPTTQPGAQAQPIDSSLAAAAQPILNQLAATEAPGAKPIGAPLVGNFAQGQQLEAAVTLQPGKCYTVVGAGLPNVAELNIQLAPPIQGAPILAVDKTTGPQAVLGGKATGCYQHAFPIAGPAKVILIVAGGTGIAAAQVYEK